MKCSVCGNDRLLYTYHSRVPEWWEAFLKSSYLAACGADPRHDVNLLVYDVEAVI